MSEDEDEIGQDLVLHRYFPEWADLPTAPGGQQESERNSYLAGGYADEFGYGTDPGRPPAIPPLDGDPEDSCLRWEQVGALHPGYPRCAKPLDRYGVEARPHPLAARLSRHEPQAQAEFKVIRVRSRNTATPVHPALRLPVVAFVSERLIRRRHLSRMR